MNKYRVLLANGTDLIIKADSHFVDDEGNLIFITDFICEECGEDEVEFPHVFARNFWMGTMKVGI